LLGFINIKIELIISAEAIIKLTQQIYINKDFKYPFINAEMIDGAIDNPIMGKVIYNQKCLLGIISLGVIQRNTPPLYVILRSHFLYMTII
jgi:hypothetical protein